MVILTASSRVENFGRFSTCQLQFDRGHSDPNQGVSTKAHLYEQWRFQFLSRLTDFARLFIQFCQALRPILG
jgi:hypothetical protein